MTVNTTNITSGPYVGNGALGIYDYDFPITDETELEVWETTDLGVKTLLTVGVGYSVQGVGGASGTVTRLAGNLPTDYIWYIRSNRIENQKTAFGSQGAFFSDLHEAAFDKLTILYQQFKDAFTGRSIRLDESDESAESVSMVLPDPSTRGSQYLGFDASGGVITFPSGGAFLNYYNLPGASYDSKFFSIAAQENITQSVFFKPDGTKMYIVGDQNKIIYQYTLSTAWDVSTVSYDSKFFSIAAQESIPTELVFDPDGTKMYIVGDANNTVYQYTLSTAWDVSTASYDSKSFSVVAQESIPTGLFFKPDGTKMYIVGIANGTVYQYTLSTAWDISTAFYDSKSFSVVAQESNPQSVFFKSDGTKMYIVGNANDTVHQYTLSTAWDISTASYDNEFFSVAGWENVPTGLFFKPDGTKMYIVGDQNDTVYQYTTASPYVISSFMETLLDDNDIETALGTLGLSKGSDAASAGTLVLGVGNYFDVTGTTAILAIGSKFIGAQLILQFDGVLTFTHHATDLILPGGANITTAAGDHAIMVEYDTGKWRCISYIRSFMAPISAPGINEDFLSLKSGIPSWQTFPSFSVHKNGASQSLAINTWTKITWPTEDYDSNSDFTSDRFTPTEAGKYSLDAAIQWTSMPSDVFCEIAVYKNGVSYKEIGIVHGGAASYTQSLPINLSSVIANGSTDYFEIWVRYGTGGAPNESISGASKDTWFMGSRVS